MRKNNLEKIWQQVPPDYYQTGISSNILQKFWHAQKLKTLKKLTANKKFSTVLDLGCASGYMANEVSKLFPKSKITGVDVYRSALIYGKQTYPHIKFVLGDAHKLPFRNNTFELVICYETIEHVVNPIRVLQEIKRVVKTNGIAIVAMDSGSHLFRIVWWIWEKTFGRAWQGAHLHPFHHLALESVIRQAGFKIQKKCFSHFGMEVSFVLTKN